MNGMLDWGEDPAKSGKTNAPTGGAGGRKTVTVLMCSACQSTEVQQRQIIGLSAYWACTLCGHRWKEDRGVGSAKATIA